MDFIFLFPTELEAAPFSKLYPEAEIVISGVGMAATAATLARLHHEGRLTNRIVVMAGIAGSYDTSYPVGSVVEVVSECCAELPERFRTTYRNTPSTTLSKARSNTSHTPLTHHHDADIENMEGATLFAMANTLGLKIIEIRAISNIVGESFDNWRIDEALNNLAHTLLTLVHERE